RPADDRRTVRQHDVVVRDTCGDADHGAEYGINVFNSGPVIIENSGANGIIQVANNNSHHNTIPGVETEAAIGIFINNSDDVRIRNNTVQNNGELGVDISAGSDDNRLIDNTITDNPTDLINEGAGNCGSGNTIGTRAGNPLTPCG